MGRRRASSRSGRGEPGSSRVPFYSLPPSVSVRREFEHDVAEPGPLETALEEMTKTLAERLDTRAGQRLTVCLFG